MKLDHRTGRALFVLVVSVTVVLFTYRWVTDPGPRLERDAEEAAVLAARAHLSTVVGSTGLEMVDPLATDREVGKGYVYAEEPGWAVSGFYRRDDDDRWHPYLMYLTADLELHSFKADDDTPGVKQGLMPRGQ